MAWAELQGARLFVGCKRTRLLGLVPTARPASFRTSPRLQPRAGRVEGAGFTLMPPLQHMTKADIEREAQRIGPTPDQPQLHDPAADGGAGSLCDCLDWRKGSRKRDSRSNTLRGTLWRTPARKVPTRKGEGVQAVAAR